MIAQTLPGVEESGPVYKDRWGRVHKTYEGFTLSAWKSVVVKGLRMGWPAGLRKAEEALAPRKLENLMVAGLFEDVFPAPSELAAAFREILERDYEALCARETLHARGFIEAYLRCPFASQLKPARIQALREKVKELGLPALSNMALANFNAWLEIEPADAGVKRSVDLTPWTGMPSAMIDGHTPEGRKRRIDATILSGHPEQHEEIARLVKELGWEEIRRRVHEEA